MRLETGRQAPVLSDQEAVEVNLLQPGGGVIGGDKVVVLPVGELGERRTTGHVADQFTRDL